MNRLKVRDKCHISGVYLNFNFHFHFQSFIHVSTAYSNADKRDIDETVYEPPHDPSTIINCVDALPQEAVKLLSEKLLVSCNLVFSL